jgi:HAD superfamily hydrolase (TIGR01549 family)
VLKAVIFDLYGTLVFARERTVHKEIPRALGVPGRRWVELIRSELLRRGFADVPAFVRFVRERLAAERPEAEATLQALVERELASVEAAPAARSLLAFLKRRGFAVGLLSNLASPHRAAVERLGLTQHVDAAGYSCDEGITKPDPELYRRLLARLGARPEEALMLGDSEQNDVAAPRGLGMLGLLVDPEAASGALREASDLGFLALGGDDPLRALVAEGDRVTLDGRAGSLRGLRMLNDDEQGRYNLVARAHLVHDDGSSRDVFCKRFLFPEAVHVEEFAHRIHAAMGVASCPVQVTAGPEPCLVVAKAEGVKMEQGSVAPDLAREIGRQCAMAYLFANADLRPRNAFLAWQGGAPRVTLVDLEHCFFNMAMDVSGLGDPLVPETFDRLPEAELERRVLKRVLTERTTRRARRTFFETDSLESATASAFKDGWLDIYRRAQGRADQLCAMLEERVVRPPYLIIGTQSYRRAMARADVRDIRSRILQDPERVFVACF